MAEQQGNATIALACTNCGAPLEIGSDVERFACAFCGTPQRVERKGGTVALRKLEGAIGAVQRGTDKTAAELSVEGRHDPIIVPRAIPVLEAVTAIAILDLLLDSKFYKYD